MPIKWVIVAAALVFMLLAALFGAYHTGYTSGASAVLHQAQQSTISQTDKAISLANQQTKKQSVIVHQLMNNQTDFLASVDKVIAAEHLELAQPQATPALLTQPVDRVTYDKQQTLVCVHGIDADELRKLQHITQAANAY